MPRVLHELLLPSAAARPEGIAVYWKDETVPYGELDRLTNQIAHTLRANGCKSGDRVAMLIPNSANAIFAMLGILKAGCIAVPLDTTTPAARMAEILGECRPTLVLAAHCARSLLDQLLIHNTAPFSIGTLEAMPINGEFFSTDFCGLNILRASTAAPACGATTHAPALFFFHCGEMACDVNDALASPKFKAYFTAPQRPTVVTHADMFAFLATAQAIFGLTEFDRVAALPLLTPLAVAATLTALAAGAELHVVPQELLARPRQVATFVRSHELTEWLTNHGSLTELLRSDALRHGDFPALKRLLWSGAPLPAAILAELQQRLPLTQFARVVASADAKLAGQFELTTSVPELEPFVASLPLLEVAAMR